MTDKEWEQIKPAAEAWELAKKRLQAAGTRNYYRGASARQLIEAAELEDRIVAEVKEAKRVLDEVQQRVLGKVYSL